MIFQNSLIKSLIYKIKKVKISRISWQLQIDEIVNKMSKIIKNKKTNSKPKNFEKKIFHISIFFLKELLEFYRNR